MIHKIITIGRQFGSGGHEIADRLSKELGIPMYDRSLVEMAADKLGLSEFTVEEVDESIFNTFLSAYRYNGLAPRRMPLNDCTYEVQRSIIESLGKKGPCIIVGRCADYILRNEPGCISLFLSASLESRINRIMERYHISKKEAETSIKRTDNRRKHYYETFTGQKWGNTESYQLLINISRLGMEQTVNVIKHIYNTLPEETRNPAPPC